MQNAYNKHGPVQDRRGDVTFGEKENEIKKGLVLGCLNSNNVKKSQTNIIKVLNK